TSSGSGLVHCAPGCGPEDYEVGRLYEVPPFNNLDEYGNYPPEMGEFSGWNAKKDNKKFIQKLDELGALIASTPVEHEYAHCWRCKHPVVFRTTKQWFFKVEDLKDKMRQLNEGVLWIPRWAGSNSFDSWLNNLRDNGITRQRYWGTPLPVWKCDKCGEYTVVGSVAELKELAGSVPDDLHKPYIDEVKIPCKCGSQKDRIPDILDVWIDAGTTSWTCLDYPQRTDLFEKMWPPDFILEGKDQIRGWFNLLLVASMVSMEKHSYKACYMHGFVQDAQGRKMSKSLGNYILPEEVVDKYGADTLRYYMIGGASPGVDINYNFEDLKVKSKNLTVLWNLGNYLVDYAKTLGVNAKDAQELSELGVEEKYILSKLNSTLHSVSELFENYALNEIPSAIEELYLELSRTYIQLTREKSAMGSEQEKKLVLNTIYKVLMGVLKMLAPIAPFISEAMYQNLKDAFGHKEFSIHLFDWPEHDEKLIDKNLEIAMDNVSSVVQSSLAGREKMGMGVRWPIQEITVVTKDDFVTKSVEELKDIIKTQVNVKEINVMEHMPGVKLSIKANFKTIGPDFGQAVAVIIPKLTSESAETIVGHIEKEGKYTLKVDKMKYEIKKEHIIIERQVPTKYQEAEFRQGFVYLNKTMTEELEAEGYSREVMRRVQALRKDAGLEKVDRVILYIKADEEMAGMLSKYVEQIQEKVGADKIKIDHVDPARKHAHHSVEKIKGNEFGIWLDKV
ncbi:MAG: class I tRNA ligase family protein, partial [Nanoarchaeota archaeon]|nr:class I tRNA ligase family protein [Nanoarchaeota archaeon]